MKKAKIMLTAITVLAVVGGALAFKAKTFSGGNVYTQKDPSSGFCTILSTQLTADDESSLKIEGFTTNNQPCPADFAVRVVE